MMPAKKNVVSVPRYENYSPRSEQTSRVGASNRRQNTTPEILLRAALRASGIRYRANAIALPGCPDFILVDAKVAVFCDGDFWHGRNWAKRKARLLAGWNATYWVAKIERNRQRDRSATRSLQKLGWRVIRVWESEVRRDPFLTVSRILKRLTNRG